MEKSRYDLLIISTLFFIGMYLKFYKKVYFFLCLIYNNNVLL